MKAGSSIQRQQKHPKAIVAEKTGALKNNIDKVDGNDANANTPEYFRSSTNRAADKEQARH